jgi:hypothetical protein
MYIQPSFLNSCEEHGLWSGGNDQYRGDRSVDFSTFTKGGRARVEAFSDAALEANKEKRKTSIPLVDRILPQQRRVRVLTEQLIELEAERRAGMDIITYSKLRDVLICKRDRAEILYKRAVSVKPNRTDEDTLDFQGETPEDGGETTYKIIDQYSTNAPVATPCGVSWIDDLPRTNSFRKPLKIACTLTRKALELSQAARNYYLTLKAL